MCMITEAWCLGPVVIAAPARLDPHRPGRNRDPRGATERARVALRGYAWVTVVPPEMVERPGSPRRNAQTKHPPERTRCS
jgi:hypothetical protein